MESLKHDRPVLAVVVGTYNRLDQLRELMRSVAEQTRTPYRVYVTDAGSRDGTVEYLRDLAARDARVVPFLTGRKIGQARALNEVFRLIDTEFVCWVSDDNVVVDRGLDVAVEILRTQPKIGMVGLKVKDVRGPWVKAPYIGGISSLGVLNVNQGMLRTELLNELGGFDHEFHDYGIDPDLTTRVLFSGWDIAYTRQVAIHHYREWAETSSPEELSRRRERQRRAMEIYKQKFAQAGSRWQKLSWHLKRRVFDAAVDLLARLGKHYRQRQEPIFGYHFRDYHNAFHARFISVLTLLRHRKEPFYLLQKGVKCPDVVRLPTEESQKSAA